MNLQQGTNNQSNKATEQDANAQQLGAGKSANTKVPQSKSGGHTTLGTSSTHSSGSILGLFGKRGQLTPTFDMNEITALIGYAAEKGIGLGGELESLQDAVFKYQQGSTLDTEKEVLVSYAKLCQKTQPVIGRNVVGHRHLWRETQLFMLATTLIFIMSISALAVGLWLSDEVLSDEIYFGFSSDVFNHYLPFVTPFLWGALGSCIYILKRINDESSNMSFDAHLFKGWLSRALLGAVLGGSIVHVIDPASIDTVMVSSTAFAFLTGVGTKVVYGALEKLIELLAEKLNLQSLNRKATSSQVISEFLAAEIANIDPTTDKEKYDALVALLNSRT
ncbi:MAG: hypothetical protein HWE25_14260 [Alphaproteobacteria bacterium]|nr:hypothetical protein [Alphaproteobacteria bacterium]